MRMPIIMRITHLMIISNTIVIIIHQQQRQQQNRHLQLATLFLGVVPMGAFCEIHNI